MKIALLQYLLLPVLSVLALAQKPGAPVADYSAEPLVIEHLDSVYNMAADGTGWHQTTMAVHIQSDASLKSLGVLMIPYASSSEHVEIVYARVRRPNGTVIETSVAEAIEMPDPVTREAPFYSDLKQKQLPIRSLSVGDILEWQAKVMRTRSEAPGHFWGQESFSDDAVTLSQSLELRVPKDLFVTVWSPTLKPVETIVGTQRIYRWTTSQTKPTVGKEADSEKELKAKQIWTAEQELDATEGKLPTVAWTTFKNWEAVGAWFRATEGDRMLPDALVKSKVAELVAAKSSEQEKVRAVYAYVSTQIRYIGVAFGVGRYQPHAATEVLENQYGDCKDKHTLLAAMLTALGLHPDAALIGAGVRFNQAVPSPASFNHLITTVPIDGQAVWLDATAEVAPYRMLMFGLRDRFALVIPGTGVAHIERTPPALPFSAFQTLHATGALDKEGTSNSRLVLTLRGDTELIVRIWLRSLPASQYGAAVQHLSQSMGYAGTTSHEQISRLEDTAEPLTISYDYKRDKAGDWDNRKIIPQVIPVYLPRPDEKDPPVRMLALGLPRVETSNSEIKLPDGWGVELPEAVHAKSSYATYDQTYRFEKGTLYSQRRVEVLQEKVPVAEWKAYKKWADTADLGNDKFVQLTHTGDKTSKPAEGVATSAPLSNPEAEKLMTTVFSDMQHNDLTAAAATLKQIETLNPEQPRLWFGYGWVKFGQGAMNEAVADFKKELALYPERYEAYPVLASAQLYLGQRQNAKETYRKWAAAQESEPTPSSQLASLMLVDHEAKDAITMLEAAIQRLPENRKKDEGLQYELGSAQLMAGLNEKGGVTLLGLLQTTENTAMINAAAYTLADASQQLPAADTATRKALNTIEEESAAWTMDENQQILLSKTYLIAATWDTMGWILYREGKLDEAETYLRSAWLHRQDGVVGGHLGDLESALGKKNEALTTYDLALATSNGTSSTLPSDRLRLKEHADSLRKEGATSSAHDATQTLQNLRTYPLGTANGLKGTAEYRLLITAAGVKRVEAKDGTKELLGGAERIKEVQFPGLFPAGSHASLVRSVALTCYADKCELVMEP